MSCRLRDKTTTPPGTFIFDQGGRKFSGPFAPSVAGQISSFRVANRLPRASLDESMQDLVDATCARLGSDKKYCICDGEPIPGHPTQVATCAGCGAQLT
jgi:hypothetical protein